MPVTVMESRDRGKRTECCFAWYTSPIGHVEIAGTADAVTALNFVENRRQGGNPSEPVRAALGQISEYFEGKRRSFDLPVHLAGTDFQQSVWRQLLTVGYGHTASYGDIAEAVGNPKAVRAVGGANGSNPISIILPCHRIIGSNGTLTGYGGGLWRKQWLLEHEGIRVTPAGRIRADHLKPDAGGEMP